MSNDFERANCTVCGSRYSHERGCLPTCSPICDKIYEAEQAVAAALARSEKAVAQFTGSVGLVQPTESVAPGYPLAESVGKVNEAGKTISKQTKEP